MRGSTFWQHNDIGSLRLVSYHTIVAGLFFLLRQTFSRFGLCKETQNVWEGTIRFERSQKSTVWFQSFCRLVLRQNGHYFAFSCHAIDSWVVLALAGQAGQANFNRRIFSIHWITTESLIKIHLSDYMDMTSNFGRGDNAELRFVSTVLVQQRIRKQIHSSFRRRKIDFCHCRTRYNLD